MKKELAILFSIFLIITFSELSAASKVAEITLDEEGFSSNKITWKIRVNGYTNYIPKSEWKIQIPKNIKELSLSDPEGSIDYEIRNLDSDSNLLVFQNRHSIYFFSDYFFEIKYIELNNPLVLEPNYLYKRTFKEENFLLEVNLPKESILTNSIPNYKSFEQNKLKYEIDSQTEISIEFNIPSKEIEYQEITSKYYQVTVPKRYSQLFAEVLAEADKAIPILEENYGYHSPESWKITLSEDFEKPEKINGAYLGNGKIFLKYNVLQKQKEEILELIIHETVHGFNSKYFNEVEPNFWFQEGTAIYYSYLALDNLGYDTSSSRNELNILSSSCKESKEIIPMWSPGKLLLSPEEEVVCNKDISTDKITLGYAQSYIIIEKLANNFGENFLVKFFQTVEAEKAQFTSERQALNNQINFILSKSTGTDTTDLLQNLGIETTRKTITGFNALNDEEKDVNYLLLSILLAIIITAAIIRFNANRRN